MGILNYSTKISAQMSAAEISGKLAYMGANSVQIVYDERRLPVGISFIIQVTGSFVEFRLPCRWQGVKRAIEKDKSIPRTFKTDEQALRVSWRIVKDWIEAQMAIIESQSAELAEVFLPYAVNPNSGMTLFQTFEESPTRLLNSGDEIVDGEYTESEQNG